MFFFFSSRRRQTKFALGSGGWRCGRERAAKQAEHWARMRNDEMPEEVYCAAFMHYLGEMYIAIYVPNLMNFVRNMQGNTNLVSEEAEYVVLGFTFAEMTINLAESWGLPKFVKQSLHIENVENPRSYGVILASELIQAASADWYSEKTWGLQLAAAAWLDMKPEKVMTDNHTLAVTVARNCILTEIPPLAGSLLYKPAKHEFTDNKTVVGTIKKEPVTVCLTPQQNEFDEALEKITNHQEHFDNINDVIKAALHGMHDGIGLNRVAFYLLVKDHSALHNYMSIGVENDPIFNKFRINLTDNNIFVDILKRQQAVWVNSANSDTIIKRLPKEFYEMISIETFYTMSVFIRNKAVGLFYADRHSRTCGMDDKGYTNFKSLAKHTAIALEYLA